MSYIDQSTRPSPAGMAAVIGVHAAIGAILVAGLTVTGTIPAIITSTEATNIPIEPPPPTPPEAIDPQPAPKDTTVIHAPKPPRDLTVRDTYIETTPIIVPTVPTVPGTGLELPRPDPRPSFDPVGAKPRNDPGAWLSTGDYRPSWIRREMTGLARFRLDIAATGRVTNCVVTGSTGHAPLDAATCKLVSQRARFEPARGGNGEAVADSYNGAVLWQLPE